MQQHLPSTAILPTIPAEYLASANDKTDEATSDSLEDYGKYTTLRHKLTHHIELLADTLADDPETIHIRAMALSRLLDRVIKLEDYAVSEEPRHLIIEYAYDGGLHPHPPWLETDDDNPAATQTQAWWE